MKTTYSRTISIVITMVDDYVLLLYPDKSEADLFSCVNVPAI